MIKVLLYTAGNMDISFKFIYTMRFDENFEDLHMAKKWWESSILCDLHLPVHDGYDFSDLMQIQYTLIWHENDSNLIAKCFNDKMTWINTST